MHAVGANSAPYQSSAVALCRFQHRAGAARLCLGWQSCAAALVRCYPTSPVRPGPSRPSPLHFAQLGMRQPAQYQQRALASTLAARVPCAKSDRKCTFCGRAAAGLEPIQSQRHQPAASPTTVVLLELLFALHHHPHCHRKLQDAFEDLVSNLYSLLIYFWDTRAL
jgi:hypothetical protein